MRFCSRILLSQKIIAAVGFFVLNGFFNMHAVATERFLNNGDDTVTDTKTSLMWAAKDNGTPINWPNALFYCQNYSGGKHTDWRMPTLAELASLYNPKHKNQHGYHVPKLINTTAETCWASETLGYKAARFNFTYGQIYWIRQSYSGPTRVLPVRSGN